MVTNGGNEICQSDNHILTIQFLAQIGVGKLGFQVLATFGLVKSGTDI